MTLVRMGNRTTDTVKSFSQLLTETASAHNSLLCVGLDPRADDAASARDECRRLIEATAEYAAAVKVNSAFFEVFGAEGFAALRDVITHVPAGIPVILDAKRGDIADTAEAYARAAFDTLNAQAVTVNPYLGGEALAPFLAQREHGVFVLCKTSNPGADEFQALEVNGRALFEVVAEHVQQWNTNDNVGLVVGATDPTALERVRTIAPDLWFLVPGIGAQGGDLAATLDAGLRADGLGLLINVSRALARSDDPRALAKQLRNEINEHRLKPRGYEPNAIEPLARDLIASGCVRFGEFKLRSGVISPIYLDLRRLISHPAILQRVARAYAAKLRELSFDRLAGIPYAGLPIATAVALEMKRPLIYSRREAKTYGTRVEIEGEYAPGETIAVIDDLATTGDTKIESIQKLEAAELVVHDIIVLIDREQGARETLAAARYRLHAVATLRQLLAEWQHRGDITSEQFHQVMKFLETQ